MYKPQLKFKIHVPFKGICVVRLETVNHFTEEIIEDVLENNPDLTVKGHKTNARQLFAAPSSKSYASLLFVCVCIGIEVLVINFCDYFHMNGFLWNLPGLMFIVLYVWFTVKTTKKVYLYKKEQRLADYYNQLADDYKLGKMN